MTILEKVEKSLDFLKSPENSAKINELQNYAGALGQCMGILGAHPSITQYKSLLQQSIPILLSLCCHNSAEIRLVADEALNRIIVGGLPYHSSRLHLHFHKSITSDKHPRWLRAALSRVYLGTTWLSAGTGNGRIFAQSTLIRLKDIVERIKDPLLIAEKGDTLLMECLETNLPRIIKAVSPFATREEMFSLLSTLITLVDSPTAPIRRNTASCIADLCQYYKKKFIPHVLNAALGALQEKTVSTDTILGWFGTLKMVFGLNTIYKLDSDVLPVGKYMMLYHTCLHYIDSTKNNHNVLNATMDCLNTIICDADAALKLALLNTKGPICLSVIKDKRKMKTHHRSLSHVSMVQSMMSTTSSMANLSEDLLGSEQIDNVMIQSSYLHGNSRNQTPHRSIEDLSLRGIHTPDSPCESMMSELNSDIMTYEQFSTYFKEKFNENSKDHEDTQSINTAVDDDLENNTFNKDINYNINIGNFNDEDVPLKYCARLLVSRFLLAGYSGETVADSSVRVSVKASALTCFNSIVEIYPEIITMCLGIQNDSPIHNLSGNSEVSNVSNNEPLNDFVLERNICYQESLTDSFGQDLLSKSTDFISQASGTGSNKSGMSCKILQKKEKLKSLNQESMEGSLAGLPSNMLDSKQSIVNNPSNQMGISCMSGDSLNFAMTSSNFTMGSQTTASNYPASTDQLSTSIDPLTSSLDLEIIFDHFGDSTASADNINKQTEIEQNVEKFDIEQMVQELQVATENLINYDQPTSNIKKYDKTDNASITNVDSKIETPNNTNTESKESSSKIEKIEENTNQHISELLFLFENHSDPQIRGLVRMCIGSLLNSICNVTSGEYSKWKHWGMVPENTIKKMRIDYLLQILLDGITDGIPQCINHSLMGLKKCVVSFCNSQHHLIQMILNYIRQVEETTYWLCKVNLCNFYAALDYKRLNIIMSDWQVRCWQILEILIGFLKDQDQRVRKATIDALMKFLPDFHSPINYDKNLMLVRLAHDQNENLLFTKIKKDSTILSDFKHSFIYSSLPSSMREIKSDDENTHLSETNLLYSNLKCVVNTLSEKLMTSTCKYYTQGCLEALLQISLAYPPIKYKDAYCGSGLLDLSLQILEYRTLSVACSETVLAFLTQLYAVYAWNSLCQGNSNKRSSVISLPAHISKDGQKSWNQFESAAFSAKAEHFFKLTLKFMNIFIHVIQDVTPQSIQPKTSIMANSPLKKKTDEVLKRNSFNVADVSSPDDKSKRRMNFNTTSGNFMPVGYFYNNVILMKLYSNLKAAYSTHKVSIDSTSSVFLNFMSTVIDSLTVQMEFLSEKEAGKNSEEMLYYLKYLLPLKAKNTVSCVTQLVKCLFSVNATAQCRGLQSFLFESSAFQNIKSKDSKTKISFYRDILTHNSENLSFDSVANYNEKMLPPLSDTSENRLNYKIAEGFGKNSHLQYERDCYLSIKNYTKTKTDKEWSIHKQEFSKYIKLVEPVVVQALKCYTIQNNINLQCRVLELMNQLLALRINYCFLNSDGVFIEFVLKQLEFIERCEICDSSELVRYIFTFLVHLSTAEHHTKQLMDIPKLMQLCDGLMASEVYDECIQSLHPLAYKIFVLQQPMPGQSRIQIQEAQVTKEVLFSMLQKMMRDTQVIKLISSVLIFSEEHPESHFKWSQLVCDTIFHLLKQKDVELNNCESFVYLDKLFDCIHREVLYDQSKIESVLRIMFDNPPLQEDAPLKLKERWLATMLLFLKKIIYNLAENEILLSLNYLKTSYISPASIFFNSHNEIDPLNVQTVNENCANLSPDVIFVRFLFRIMSYALLEIENCDKRELIEPEKESNAKNYSYWCKLTNSLIFFIKDILYLKDGCRFPLLAKTAQTVLQNEQSGLNTGLYSPEENIPLKRLAAVCIKLSSSFPMLTVHWCHLLIRLKFLEQKFMAPLIGFVHNSGICMDGSQRNLDSEILQVGIFLTLCEHFVDHGLDEVINLTWFLVNRIHLLIQYYNEDIVKDFVSKINDNPSASVLLLQAVTTRCQSHMKGTYGIKVYNMISKCHQSQSGSLLFSICCFVGRLPISSAPYFVKLAIKRCEYLATIPIEEACHQLLIDDVHRAMEILHNDRVDKKYPELVNEINKLACSLYNLSPLDIPLERPINPQNIKTTSLDMEWLLSQIKNRCYKYSNNPITYGKHLSVAKILKAVSADDLNALFNSAEFDVEIIQHTLKIGTDTYIREFVDKLMEQQCVEAEKRRILIEHKISECDEFLVKENFMESSIFTIPNLNKLKKIKAQSQFFVPVEHPTDNRNEIKKANIPINNEKSDVVLPEFTPLLSTSLKQFTKLVLSVVTLFPKTFRPLSHFEMGSLRDCQTMDKYTKRCCVVFRDKFFHQLLLNVQSLVTAYLDCVKNIRSHLEKADCDVTDKVIDIFLPKKLYVNLMHFSVISLQYSSYLINQFEDSLNIDFTHNNSAKLDLKDLDYTLDLCIANASRCFTIQSIWSELNVQENLLKFFSAVSCLYNYVKYALKDTLPLNFLSIVSANEHLDDSIEISMICDKLLTLVHYWQNNHSTKMKNCMSSIMRNHVENLMISLCRCKFASSFTLIPTCAWEGLQLFENVTKIEPDTETNKQSVENNKIKRVIKSDFAIPIDILQDMDLLEQFLYRVNLIGWTNKKGFEEIWVSFLGALQGNGTHWAVRGMMQLLLSANYTNCGRDSVIPTSRMRKLKQIALDCNFYEILFSDTNLENVPYKPSKGHYSQASIDYLKYAAGLNDFPDIRVQNAVAHSKKSIQSAGIDITSCIQLLIDIASQVLAQSDWGLGARNALLSCIVNISDIFTNKMQWQWLAQQLSSMPAATDSIDILTQQYIILGQAKVHCVLGLDIPDVNQLTAALSSSFAPTRIAALHSAIMHLSLCNDVSLIGMEPSLRIAQEQFNSMLEISLLSIIQPHLTPRAIVSHYEQTLCWTALFQIVNSGNNDILKIAVDFFFTNQNHFCSNLILQGICRAALKNSGTLENEIVTTIFKVVESHPEKCYHFLPLLLTQIYAGNDVQTPENSHEPEQLLVHLQTFSTLQKSITLSQLDHSRSICKALVYYLRDFLPPAAILNKVVQEFIDCCRWADSQHLDRHIALTNTNIGLQLAPFYVELLGNMVFEVFEESIAQEQLLIFNGWLFDGLNHFLEDKISPTFIPFCLLALVTSASANKFVRSMAPIINYILRAGCSVNHLTDHISQNVECTNNKMESVIPAKSQGKTGTKMSFNDMRLLCLGAVHSNFTKFQLEKLKAICVGKTVLNDLRLSLDV